MLFEITDEDYCGSENGAMITPFFSPVQARLARCPMTYKLLPAFVVTVGVLTAGRPALAHHGNAAYADTITEFKQATVTKVLWSNPHALIDFDAKNAKGE